MTTESLSAHGDDGDDDDDDHSNSERRTSRTGIESV